MGGHNIMKPPSGSPHTVILPNVGVMLGNEWEKSKWHNMLRKDIVDQGFDFPVFKESVFLDLNIIHEPPEALYGAAKGRVVMLAKPVTFRK